MGKAIAIELAKNGAKVVLSKGGEATFAQIEVKDKADVVRLVNTPVSRYITKKRL